MFLVSGCFPPLNSNLLIFFFRTSTRGPPDISSLVPVGPKYTMKWSAPLQQVQVVEAGQEGPQGKDTFFQQSGAKRTGGACTSGNNQGVGPGVGPGEGPGGDWPLKCQYSLLNKPEAMTTLLHKEMFTC